MIAYVEGPLCFYHAALLWAAVRGLGPIARSRGAADLVPDRSLGRLRHGLQVSGLDLRCRFPSGPLPSGRLQAESHRLRRCFCYVLGWGVVMGPWLAKNVIDTGNPVYPLADSIFHGRHWDQALRDRSGRTAHGRRAVTMTES